MRTNHTSISASSIRTLAALREGQFLILHTYEIGPYRCSMLQTARELILQVILDNGRLLVLRLSDGVFDADPVPEAAFGAMHHFQSMDAFGKRTITLQISFSEIAGLQVDFSVDFRPTMPVSEMELPRELLILKARDYGIPTEGTLYWQQQQLRSGGVFVDFGARSNGSLLYVQELGALNAFAEESEISLADCVQVNWPEIGCALVGSAEHPLQPDTTYALRRTHLVYRPEKPKDLNEASNQHLDGLLAIYKKIPVPTPKPLKPLHRYASLTLRDLETHGCWKQVAEHAYLNAYMNDYVNPPESMVQLAVLVPLWHYNQRFPSQRAERLIQILSRGFGAFFDSKLASFGRWIPNKAHELDFDEEHKKARIMDSWYLYYPLIQLATLLESGFNAPELENKFFDSLDYVEKVAKHFDYQWPIFFDLDTLDLIKEEASPGQGGEKDVAGMYAFLMLRVYALTKQKRYLTEAKRAGQQLFEYGFDLLYQANNTAYAAEALLELWTLTRNERYLKTSVMALSNLIRNCSIWERTYGNSKTYPNFFSLFPLKDTPYSALFEEHETLASFHRYLRNAHTSAAPLPEALVTFMTEYIRYAVRRFPYYYPPRLPDDILASGREVKTGFLNKNLWVPVEDLGDGWEPVGQVGQEVYGAGGMFQLIRYHTVRLNNEDYCLIDCPFIETNRSPDGIDVQLLGSKQSPVVLQFFGRGRETYSVRTARGLINLQTAQRSLEVPAHAQIAISWRHTHKKRKRYTS